MKFFRPIRQLRAVQNLEIILVSAAVSIVAIRLFLDFTGFPQVGGSLHIAHMLWGGLLMFVSIVIFSSFLNNSLFRLTLFLGGIGLGVFIDELGKFITKDNNYFFEPTFAIIYIFFILFYLFIKFVNAKLTLSEEDYLQNALELTRIALEDKSSSEYKQQALEMLSYCKDSNPLVHSLKNYLDSINYPPSWYHQIRIKINIMIHALYNNLLRRKLIGVTILVLFAIHSILDLYRAIDILSLYFKVEDFTLTFIDIGELISLIGSSALVVMGILIPRLSTLIRFRLFRFSLIISIFLTQFFNFYKNQLSAIIILLYNLLVLYVIEFLIKKQEAAQSDKDLSVPHEINLRRDIKPIITIFSLFFTPSRGVIVSIILSATILLGNKFIIISIAGMLLCISYILLFIYFYTRHIAYTTPQNGILLRYYLTKIVISPITLLVIGVFLQFFGANVSYANELGLFFTLFSVVLLRHYYLRYQKEGVPNYQNPQAKRH